jgi:hypothetical protein
LAQVPAEIIVSFTVPAEIIASFKITHILVRQKLTALWTAKYSDNLKMMAATTAATAALAGVTSAHHHRL